MRLDTKDGAHAAIKPGKIDESDLIQRIDSDDEDLLMPPPDSNRKLSVTQKSLLKRWVASGAEWGKHWSFTPIAKPSPPNVEAFTKKLSTIPEMGDWARHPIDQFVLRKMNEEGYRPSPQANRESLIRRVSLDLTGLPPAIEDIEAFLDDKSPNAYEKVVDRLLASPAYGERMAWNWLDAARYADSNGYQGDSERTMWPWRDWVVRAFNKNMRYDQFTKWQLAGDLMPDANFEQKLATGFLRNHMINGEGGRIPEENRVDYVLDMTETMGTVWLGLTLNCSRCHDHKYDPITQKDYYSLSAFFNQTPVDGRGRSGQAAPVLLAPTPEQNVLIAQRERELKDQKEQLNRRIEELNKLQPEWEKKQLAAVDTENVWQLLEIDSAEAVTQNLEIQDDKSILATGPNPDNDTYTIVGHVKVGELTGLRLEALRHPSMTNGGIARSDSGNFVLTEIEINIQKGETEKPEKIVIASAEATYEQGSLKIQNTFDGNQKSGWAVYEGKPVDRNHAAVFRFKSPIKLLSDSKLSIVLRHDSVHKNHNLGRFRLAITSFNKPTLGDQKSKLQDAIATSAKSRTTEQKKLVDSEFRKTDDQYQKLLKEVEGDEKRLESARGKVAKVMVMQDISKPRETFILDRGLYNKPGDVVTENVPESLPDLPEKTLRNRLALANWLVSKDNPLTARVTVNRFWQQVFGIGLVKTPEDFGVQGEIPKHLDLLNWLAADFRDNGWDVKRLMKTIVMSETYRQTSQATSALYQADPENRYFARGPRFRMPSWMIRDQALAASGLLVKKQGGPSVNGYQPPGIWEEATFGKKKYTQDHGESLYRRSLYTFWRRIIAPTMFFDTASRQTCSVKALRTNTPLHALLTMNDVIFVEAARTLAQKTLELENKSDDERLDIIYRRVLSRSPTQQEREIFMAGLQRSRTEFKKNPQAASDMLAVGESLRNETLDAIEHASWTALCLAVFNLDEAVTKE